MGSPHLTESNSKVNKYITFIFIDENKGIEKYLKCRTVIFDGIF